MNNKLFLIASLMALIFVNGCATNTQSTTQVQASGVETNRVIKDETGKKYKVVQTFTCPSPVAKISISPLQCKASRCAPIPQAQGNMGALLALANQQSGNIDLSTMGGTMTTMLSSALSETGCFSILEREVLEALKQEMELAGKTMEVDTADFVITGSITSLTYAKEKSQMMGGMLPLGGALNRTKTKAALGVDVRLLDVNSSKVAYTKTYKSDASNNKYGFGMLGFGGGAAAAGGMSFGGDLELEETVRKVLNNVVADLIQAVAQDKYSIKETNVAL